MYFINKITSDSTVDFAAEELKKYLRMMMPEGGDVKILYAPSAKDGYRIGIFADLGIDMPSGKDPERDDCIYIDTDGIGGVIAGANPRALLIAVYEYLRKCGCRWLFPGDEGEYIPRRTPEGVKLTHTPRMRIRASCVEGATKQSMLLDFIDFLPKVGLNCFMTQYKVPKTFYRRYTLHEDHFNRVDFEEGEIDSLTRAAECEMSKRGILLHSYGHGFNNDPFGIDSTLAWDVVDESVVPKDAFQYLAYTKGRRGLFMDRVATTQNCLSNPEVRKKTADYVINYLKNHENTDALHIWLADSIYNHCECDECKKKTVSDWYAMMINEIDDRLRAEGLKNKVVFISYTETMHAPESEVVNPSDNLIFMVAPIGRDYATTEDPEGTTHPKMPYVRNGSRMPRSLGEFMQYTSDWQNNFKGDSFVFEYHFWQFHAYDLSTLKIAKRIYEDVAYYERRGFNGIMECGAQRCFFPNGLAFYVHARATFDASYTFDELVSEYADCAYGEGKEEILSALRELELLIPSEYLNVTLAQRRDAAFISGKVKRDLDMLPALVEKIKGLADKYSTSGSRTKMVSLGLLRYYCTYLEGLGRVLSHVSIGEREKALEEQAILLEKMEALSPVLLTYFDYLQRLATIKTICQTKHVEGYVDPTM